MEREDSGIIDLHAIQNRASNTPPVPTPLSSPPPAFTMEVGESDSGEVEFRPKLTKKKKLMIGAGVATAMLFLGIIAFSGSKTEPVKSAAAAPPEPTFTVARTPAPPPEPPAASAVTPPKSVPAAPATGAAASKAAPTKPSRAAKAAPKAAGKGAGVKLTKVTSSGT